MPLIPFTQRNLDSLSLPIKGSVEYRDSSKSSTSILRLVVWPTGIKVWKARYRSPTERKANGSHMERKYKIGTYPTVSINDARIRAREVLAQLDAGIDPAQVKEEEAKISVERLFEKFSTRYLRSLSDSYKYDFRRNFERDVLPAIGKMPVAELRPMQIANNLPCQSGRKPSDPNQCRILTSALDHLRDPSHGP